jgi:phage terminase large subunit-like protein
VEPRADRGDPLARTQSRPRSHPHRGRDRPRCVSSGEEADETGIIVAGKDADGHGYVLADQSGRYAPTEWARTAIGLYRQYKADRIVAEVNNGGDMVEATVRMVDPNVSYATVHARPALTTRVAP